MKKETYQAEPMKSLAEAKEIKNIYQRIIQVMHEVEYVQKTEKAAKGLPYKYISHDQVTGALHLPMARAGIVCLTNVDEFTQDGNRTRVKVKLSLINADNPDDRVEIYSYGYGIDNQDKGPGKAISYATKMALLKCFMLESGEDPEKANEDYKPDMAGMQRSAKEMLDELTPDEQISFETWLKTAFKASKVDDLEIDDLRGVLNKLISKKRLKSANINQGV